MIKGGKNPNLHGRVWKSVWPLKLITSIIQTSLSLQLISMKGGWHWKNTEYWWHVFKDTHTFFSYAVVVSLALVSLSRYSWTLFLRNFVISQDFQFYLGSSFPVLRHDCRCQQSPWAWDNIPPLTLLVTAIWRWFCSKCTHLNPRPPHHP